MDSRLLTCCGSPAYAAPELVAGKEYVGAEVVLIASLFCFSFELMSVVCRSIVSIHFLLFCLCVAEQLTNCSHFVTVET